MVGTAIGVGFVTPEQLIYFGIGFLIFLPIIARDPLKGLISFMCAFGLWWILTGKDPRDWLEKFHRPRRYMTSEPLLDFNKVGIPIPERINPESRQYVINGRKRNLYYIEKKYRFYTYGQIELEGREVGFHLLRQGRNLMFVFTWTIAGYDPNLSEEEAYYILNSATEGLNNLPKNVDLKFYGDLNCSSSDYKRMQAELLVTKELDPLTREIIRSRSKRAEELEKEGRLLAHEITVSAKYRIELGGNYAVNQNWLEELLSKTQPAVGAIRREEFDSSQAWSKVIDFAYKNAFLKVDFLLRNNKAGFGLRVVAWGVQKIFAKDYLELHEINRTNSKVPRISNYLLFNEKGLSSVVNEWGTHAIGTIFEDQVLQVVPLFDRDVVYYPARKKYAGFVLLGQMHEVPKDKGSVARGYLKYLWNIMAGCSKPIYDSRIITEITADRSGIETLNLERIITNSLKREAEAMKSQNVDVIAMRRREEAIEARDLLAGNNLPYWVSVGIWLYRDSREELEEDLSELEGQIVGASVKRVEKCLEHIWFQSQRFEWEAFLTKPHHRRKKYIDYQALPSLPLVQIEPIDERGVKFVTRELNCPIYLNFANKKNHTLIVGKTGSGKSNLMLEILIENIIHSNIVVLFDFPRPDGSSTFTVLIPLLQELGVKAVYHNVRESVINIIEMPNLSMVEDPMEKERRRNQAIESQIRLLCCLVMGTTQDDSRELLVNSLITSCYRDFHSNSKIKQRYAEAVSGGFGSREYEKMPILSDFVNYAKLWFADYIEAKKDRISAIVNDTIDIIVTQLEGVLKTALGRSIDGPSSFDTNVDILVIGLTNLSMSTDSLLYAMAGLNALYRAAFSAKRSLLGIDEGTILYKFPAFAKETGAIPTHGRKWGCNFLIAAQEIATIKNSCSGGEIFKNLDNIFGGYVDSAAIPEMTSVEVGLKEEIFSYYVNKSFRPSKELLQSYWYLKRGNMHLEITHPGSEMLLALGATDPKEDALRKKIMGKREYKNNKIGALKEFFRVNFKEENEAA